MSKQYLNKEYSINIKIYTFINLPILKIKINNEKINKIINNKKIRKIVKKQESRIIENRKNISKQLMEGFKNIKFEAEKMDLQIIIGTENAAITAFIIPVISIMVATFLSRKVQKYNDRQMFLVKPVYMNQNLINIEFSGILQIKMIHIISIICVLKKKGDRNERTSNRRSYGYGYEQY